MADILLYQDRSCLVGPVSSHSEHPSALVCITLEERDLSVLARSGWTRVQDQGTVDNGLPSALGPLGLRRDFHWKHRASVLKGQQICVQGTPWWPCPHSAGVPAPGDYHPSLLLACQIPGLSPWEAHHTSRTSTSACVSQ